ncbi:MAG: magnesium/cobalt transporter CorA [Acidobacteriota bacterium]
MDDSSSRLGFFRRQKHRAKIGSRPGILEPSEDAQATKARVVRYDAGALEERELDLQALDRGTTAVMWVDVQGLADSELLGQIAKHFGLHPLAMEDVVHAPQRPKVDLFDDQLFVVIQQLQEDLTREQISLFLGDGFVITFQERHGDPFTPVRHRLRNSLGRLRSSAHDYLAYALIDATIDSYMPLLDRFEEDLELLEEELRRPPGRDADPVERILRERARVREVRRAIGPLREVTRSLANGEWPHITESTQTFLKDCHDHALEAADQLESCREIAAGLMDAHLSSTSNQVNETTRILTVIATIFMPLSFLVGLYGMNFDTSLPGNMPELSQPYGYPVLLGAMVALAGGLFVFFRRKGWF